MGGLADLYGTMPFRGVGRAASGGMSGLREDAYTAISDKISAYYQSIAGLSPSGDEWGGNGEISAQNWRSVIADLRNAAAQAPFNTADLDASLLDSYTKAGYDTSFAPQDCLAALRVWQGLLDGDYHGTGGTSSPRRPTEAVVRRPGGRTTGGGSSQELACWPGYGLKDGACAPTPTAYAGGSAIGAVICAGIGFAVGGAKGAAVGAVVGAAAGAGGVYAASMTDAAKKPK